MTEQQTVIVKTVGFGFEVWYFPEFDMWAWGRLPRVAGQHQVLALGPLRLRFSSITIRR